MFAVFEGFYDFGDVLGAVTGADQQGVGCFDHDEAGNADCSDVFAGAPEEIAFGIERVAGSGKNIFRGMLGEEFVNRGPGADVAPTHFGGDDEDAQGAGALSGAFEDGVIDRNIFESWVDAL